MNFTKNRKFTLGLLKEPVDGPVDLMEIWHKVKLKKLAAEIQEKENEIPTNRD